MGDILFEKGEHMKKKQRFASDKLGSALDQLCHDVEERGVALPGAEDLTSAIKGLFPNEELIPANTHFELHMTHPVTWCIEENSVPFVHTEKTVWYRRLLSRHL